MHKLIVADPVNGDSNIIGPLNAACIIFVFKRSFG